MLEPNAVLLVITAVVIYFHLLFLLAMALKKNDIVDIAWGMGFILIAILSLAFSPGYHLRRILVSALVTLWGLRLSLYLYGRNKGRKEDFRYAQWKKDWGKSWVLRSYLQVFLFQAFFMLTIAYPLFFYGRSSNSPLNLLDLAGVIVWSIGFYFESLGDNQMANFKKNPANKGKIMNLGLWRYTRHPNYFGESAQWWGIFLLTLNTANGWLAVFSPIIITFLLLKVSGVPMLEKKYADNPDYRDYVKKTSSFLPLPRAK